MAKVSANNASEGARRPTLVSTLVTLTWELTWKEREKPTLVEKVSATNVCEAKRPTLMATLTTLMS